ncbi:unnamed protein product, partial [Nesidiocoris tenuis]
MKQRKRPTRTVIIFSIYRRLCIFVLSQTTSGRQIFKYVSKSLKRRLEKISE